MKPTEILLEKRYGKENKPLFNSQLDIVQSVMEYDKSLFKTEESGRTFVNQVLNGGKKLSKKLRSVLYALVEKKLSDSVLFEKTKQDLEFAFEHTYQRGKESEESEFDKLAKRTTTADKIFITTPEPAEIKANDKANELKKELLERIGIIPDTFSSKLTEYVFCFPEGKKDSGNIAFRFWKGLYEYAKVSLGILDIGDKLEKANQGKKPKIRVFEVPKQDCWLPVAVFDIDTRGESAFIVCYYDEGKKTSVAIFEGEAFRSWKEYYYSKIKPKIEQEITSPEIDTGIEELYFKDVRNDIEKFY
jgi:hypothetical protein